MSMAGEEVVRTPAWGGGEEQLSAYRKASPSLICNLPQHELEPMLVEAIEAAGVDPCDAAPDHWRHVHNRITAGQAPRAYTMERHRAWLKRREIER